MPEEEKGFEVKDRRKVKDALEGESVKDVPEDASPSADEAGTAKEEASGAGQGAGTEEAELPPVDFLSFVSSIAATAYMHLGERLAPDHPAMPVDMPAAKQMIDLLDLIKAKTKGNLDAHESEGLDAILYNLRMRYVQKGSGR